MNKIIIPISLIAGIGIGYFIAKKVVRVNSKEFIEKGNCSKDIQMFQESINRLMGHQAISSDAIGCYDKTTHEVVNKLFEGTNIIIDDQGTISKQFVNDFNKIFSNL